MIMRHYLFYRDRFNYAGQLYKGQACFIVPDFYNVPKTTVATTQNEIISATVNSSGVNTSLSASINI